LDSLNDSPEACKQTIEEGEGEELINELKNLNERLDKSSIMGEYIMEMYCKCIKCKKAIETNKLLKMKLFKRFNEEDIKVVEAINTLNLKINIVKEVLDQYIQNKHFKGVSIELFNENPICYKCAAELNKHIEKFFGSTPVCTKK